MTRTAVTNSLHNMHAAWDAMGPGALSGCLQVAPYPSVSVRSGLVETTVAHKRSVIRVSILYVCVCTHVISLYLYV